jgi:hypothetical protein
MERVCKPTEVEELELAFARLDWVRASACLHLRVQRDALKWHLESCETALAALSDEPSCSDSA